MRGKILKMTMGRALVALTLCAGVAWVSLGLAGCSPGDSKTGATVVEPLTVGMEMSYPPFEFRGEDGKPDGISVRMAEELAEYLDRPLELRDVAWKGIIPALKTGKIELIISSLTRTEERAESIDFSDGYVTNGICMLVGKNSSIQSVDDLKSPAKLAVKLGTTGHTWAEENLKGVTLIVLEEASLCALEVAQGKADAFIYDQISIYQHWKQHEDKTRPILDPIRSETWAIGIKQGNDELKEKVNAFLKEKREAGWFDEMAERYMAEEKKAFEERGVPFIFH